MSAQTSNPTGAASSNPDTYNAAALASINTKLLSKDASGAQQSFPSITLASGQTIRTGTVATLLHNMRLYDAAAAAGDREAEMEALEGEMRLAVPTLGAIGMFDLFAPDEWMAGTAAGPGRRRVGEMAREMGFGKQ